MSDSGCLGAPWPTSLLLGAAFLATSGLFGLLAACLLGGTSQRCCSGCCCRDGRLLLATCLLGSFLLTHFFCRFTLLSQGFLLLIVNSLSPVKPETLTYTVTHPPYRSWSRRLATCDSTKVSRVRFVEGFGALPVDLQPFGVGPRSMSSVSFFPFQRLVSELAIDFFQVGV